jgi:2-methylcitrate dehydratase PrpD
VNQACGFNQWAWSGGSELPLQNGMAARAGVFAYDLALTGVRASEAILEGRAGFFEAVGVGSDGADAFRRWLQRPTLGSGILEVKFKPMGCCNFTQTSTAMALKLAKGSSIVADDIKQIVVTTTSPAIRYPGCDNSGVMKTVVHGKLSIQYGVCAALVLRQLDETAWYPAGKADITGLMTKCQLVASPKFDEAFRQGLQPAKVEVTLHDGSMFAEEADDVPWLNDDEVVARFTNDLKSFGDEHRVRRLLQQCQDLANVQHCCGLLVL